MPYHLTSATTGRPIVAGTVYPPPEAPLPALRRRRVRVRLEPQTRKGRIARLVQALIEAAALRGAATEADLVRAGVPALDLAELLAPAQAEAARQRPDLLELPA